MKISRLLRPLLLGGLLTTFAAHAADPQPPVALSEADIKTLMTLLNKIATQAAAETATAAADSDEPAPAAAPAAPAAKEPAPAVQQPLSTALKTGSLSTGGLAPSSGLGGHGAGTVARLTEAAWRLLFPAKQPGN